MTSPLEYYDNNKELPCVSMYKENESKISTMKVIHCILKDTTVRPLKRIYEPNQWDQTSRLCLVDSSRH